MFVRSHRQFLCTTVGRLIFSHSASGHRTTQVSDATAPSSVDAHLNLAGRFTPAIIPFAASVDGVTQNAPFLPIAHTDPGIETSYIVAILTGLFALGLLVFFYRQYCRHRTEKLEGLIKERTRDSRLQNIQLQRTNDIISGKNAELDRLNQQLKESNQEISEFIGFVSHDLRNPLSAISQLADYLATEPAMLAPSEINEHGKTIRECCDSMFAIISSLLELYRFEESGRSIPRAAVDITAIATSSAQRFNGQACAKAIHITVEADSTPIIALGQENLFHQIFDNLISNAVKYTPPSKRIWVRTRYEGDTATFEVEDEGPGIAKDDQGKLFRKFSGLRTPTTGGESSTGLGLAIVKRMVDAIGGSVRCQSEPGQGARFQARFPSVGTTGEPELKQATLSYE